MKRMMLISLRLLLVILCAVACQRRPFVEHTTGVNLILKVNTQVVNAGDVPMPETMRVDLFDPETGAVRYTDYISSTGGYIYPAPGEYDMLLYNIGTESTLIRNEHSYDEVEAYTNDVSSFIKGQLAKFLASRAKARAERGKTKADEEERIVNEPDHLFVASGHRVDIPAFVEEEEVREITIEVDAHSVVETWKVKVVSVIGLQWVQSAVAIMSGQVESTFIGKDEDSDRIVSIYFEMDKNEEDGTIEGTFNTFGKHPEELSELSFDVNITDTGGDEHHFHFDVTEDFFDNPDNTIIIDEQIEIEEPKTGGGGFDPSVEDWEDVKTDIIL